MLLKAVNRSSNDTLLVVQKTELEESLSLDVSSLLILGNGQKFFKMFLSLMDVTISLVDLGQLLVSVTSLSLLAFVAVCNAELKETVKVLDGLVQLIELLVDVSNLLVALSLLVLVICLLGRFKTLFKILQ